MADALSANSKHTATAIEAKCASHAFRRFRSLLSTYPEQAAFVLHICGQVYDHDEHCKTHQLDDQQRLAYHNQHSRPLMEELQQWFKRILDGEAEPNSPLATECQYLAKPALGRVNALSGSIWGATGQQCPGSHAQIHDHVP
jgi:hypothetical protein